VLQLVLVAVVETGPDRVPAELPVLMGTPPVGAGHRGMVTWAGSGGVGVEDGAVRTGAV
jgi:hypothetical protein